MSLLKSRPHKPTPRPDRTDFTWLVAGLLLGSAFGILIWLLT